MQPMRTAGAGLVLRGGGALSRMDECVWASRCASWGWVWGWVEAQSAKRAQRHLHTSTASTPPAESSGTSPSMPIRRALTYRQAVAAADHTDAWESKWQQDVACHSHGYMSSSVALQWGWALSGRKR
jgi:hypothetical protein